MNYTNDTNGGMKKHLCICGSKKFVDFKAATNYTNDTNGGVKKHLCICGSKTFVDFKAATNYINGHEWWCEKTFVHLWQQIICGF